MQSTAAGQGCRAWAPEWVRGWGQEWAPPWDTWGCQIWAPWLARDPQGTPPNFGPPPGVLQTPRPPPGNELDSLLNHQSIRTLRKTEQCALVLQCQLGICRAASLCWAFSLLRFGCDDIKHPAPSQGKQESSSICAPTQQQVEQTTEAELTPRTAKQARHILVTTSTQDMFPALALALTKLLGQACKAIGTRADQAAVAGVKKHQNSC